jgi:hypothetical protein
MDVAAGIVSSKWKGIDRLAYLLRRRQYMTGPEIKSARRAVRLL